MVRRPAVYPPFPYTTLFRSSGEPGAGANVRIRGTSSVRGGNQPLFVVDGVPLSGGNDTPGGANVGAGSQSRSEEHTSELQSRGHLVCRRLLESKSVARDAPQ